MSETSNEFGQTIGFALPDWTPCEHPRGAQLTGRMCRLEPIDSERHARDLFEAFSLDSGGNWTYLPTVHSIGKVTFVTGSTQIAWAMTHAF